MKQGPPIQRLTRRLSECPAEFLNEPYIRGRGEVRVNAVVADIMAELGASLWGEGVFHKMKGRAPAERNWLRIVLIATWLLHDPWFREQDEQRGEIFATAAFRWLNDGLDEFAELVAADACVEDPDRREEFARRCQMALGLTPSDESVAQAQNRLSTLDIVAQQRVLYDTQGRQKRADELREKMVEERSYAAAGRWTRE